MRSSRRASSSKWSRARSPRRSTKFMTGSARCATNCRCPPESNCSTRRAIALPNCAESGRPPDNLAGADRGQSAAAPADQPPRTPAQIGGAMQLKALYPFEWKGQPLAAGDTFEAESPEDDALLEYWAKFGIYGPVGQQLPPQPGAPA